MQQTSPPLIPTQTPIIYISETEIQIIQKYILSSNYQNQLIELFLSAKNLPNNTHFYTDALIINAQTLHPKIGSLNTILKSNSIALFLHILTLPEQNLKQ